MEHSNVSMINIQKPRNEMLYGFTKSYSHRWRLTNNKWKWVMWFRNIFRHCAILVVVMSAGDDTVDYDGDVATTEAMTVLNLIFNKRKQSICLITTFLSQCLSVYSWTGTQRNLITHYLLVKQFCAHNISMHSAEQWTVGVFLCMCVYQTEKMKLLAFHSQKKIYILFYF